MLMFFFLGVLVGGLARADHGQKAAHAAALFTKYLLRHRHPVLARRLAADQLWREKVGVRLGGSL